MEEKSKNRQKAEIIVNDLFCIPDIIKSIDELPEKIKLSFYEICELPILSKTDFTEKLLNKLNNRTS